MSATDSALATQRALAQSDTNTRSLLRSEEGQAVLTRCLRFFYVIQGDIARGAHFGQNGKGWTDEEVSYTLNTIDIPAVVIAYE